VYDGRGSQTASLRVDANVRSWFRAVPDHPMVQEKLFVDTGWVSYSQGFQAAMPAGAYSVGGSFRRHCALAGTTFRASGAHK